MLSLIGLLAALQQCTGLSACVVGDIVPSVCGVQRAPYARLALPLKIRRAVASAAFATFAVSLAFASAFAELFGRLAARLGGVSRGRAECGSFCCRVGFGRREAHDIIFIFGAGDMFPRGF